MMSYECPLGVQRYFKKRAERKIADRAEKRSRKKERKMELDCMWLPKTFSKKERLVVASHYP
jgi:hypothetical protein